MIVANMVLVIEVIKVNMVNYDNSKKNNNCTILIQ